MKATTKPPAEARYKNPDSDPMGPYILTDVTSPIDRPLFRYEWHGQLPPAGRSWRYSKEKARSLEAEGRIVFSSAGIPKLKRYLSEAVRAVPEEDGNRASLPVLIVRVAMRAIAIAIARNPRCLRDVEWRDLERTLREVFERLGFATHLTRSGKDGGYDLVLVSQNGSKTSTFIVEVKHWVNSEKKAGRSVATALFNIVAKAASDVTGLILSSSGFTRDASNGRTEIEQRRVRLGGQTKIVSLCQNYVQSVEGLWTATTDLADMLLEGTEPTQVAHSISHSHNRAIKCSQPRRNPR